MENEDSPEMRNRNPIAANHLLSILALLALSSGILSIVLFLFLSFLYVYNPFGYKMIRIVMIASDSLIAVLGISAVFLSAFALRKIDHSTQNHISIVAVAGRRFGVIGCILGLITICATPGFLEADLRSRISLEGAKLRMVANALATYSVDWNADPQSIFILTRPFKERKGYLKDVPRSAFGDRAILRYTNVGGRGGWLIWTPGPDGIFDISIGNELNQSLESVYSKGGKPNAWFCNRIYDPTNGIISQGDIVRWRQ